MAKKQPTIEAQRREAKQILSKISALEKTYQDAERRGTYVPPIGNRAIDTLTLLRELREAWEKRLAELGE